MDKQRRNRAFLPKVKTGCWTCKARKVKCDEAKPHCRRCTSSGRDCGGYQPKQAVLPRPMDDMSSWLVSDAEKRSFDFFISRAGQRLGGFFYTPFWSREILQAALRYPSICHLVVALGAAYEGFEYGDQQAFIQDNKMRFALQQCNSSISHIVRPKTPSTPLDAQSAETICCMLTASVLLATFASIQRDLPQAIAHARYGLRILQSMGPFTVAPFPIPIDRLRSLLVSLYAQARAIINDEARTTWDHDPLVSKMQPVAHYFYLADAQRYVEELFQNTLAFSQSSDLSPPKTPEQTEAVVAQHRMLCNALRSSCDALDAFVERSGEGNEVKAIAVLRLYHELLSIRLGMNVFEDANRESAFDDLEQQLAQMLEYCKIILDDDVNGRGLEKRREPVCSSGLGVVMPLHTISARCRNPAIRKQAVNLLLKVKRREGLWDSEMAGRVASTTIELEQMAMDGEKVPADARVREVKVDFRGERGAQLTYLTVGQWKRNQSGYKRVIKW